MQPNLTKEQIDIQRSFFENWISRTPDIYMSYPFSARYFNEEKYDNEEVQFLWEVWLAIYEAMYLSNETNGYIDVEQVYDTSFAALQFNNSNKPLEPYEVDNMRKVWDEMYDAYVRLP